ncbi:hypothetical protein CASFOL_019584 [Castilleja foliolosa]|uniref:Ribosomal RNA-processing protein 12-like conserved domain-containing protein n=1 Tax=Castilleja foliolosa TaxID=1961234 RepID=A0ABD3D8Q5_9LAMI
MEGVELEMVPSAQHSDEDFCTAVLSQFSKSTNEHHLNICAAIGAMSQELIDQNQPLTHITYFGATCSSLDRLSSNSDPVGHLLDALLTILSLVIDRLSPAVLRTKYSYLSELLIRILGMKSVGVNGVLPGFKCTSLLLIVREKVEWADVSHLYGFLIGHVADDRPKVRKQLHTCLREILEYFQLAPALKPLLVPAGEAIKNVLERFLLIAGESNSTISEGPRAAQEVLYILDALQIWLPYMSSNYTTTILKYFKSLLELRYPIVTRRIDDGLNALCLHSAGEISAEALLELLCSLTTSFSPDDSSADSMTFTARLLDTEMKKVYLFNRLICVIKLTVVFNSLKDILASEHEEVSVAAVASFKSLIQSCIDESLIKQGVDQITINANETTRKTGPTVIEKVCATIESLLDYHYEPVWDMSFQIVSTLFDKLGKYSSFFLKETLKILADMQKLPDEDFALRKQLHECMGKALGAMGPETFLSLLPLNLEAQDLSESNLWLFPILKQYTVGAHLNFFTKSILPMIGEMKQKSAAHEREGKIHSARSVDGIVYSLWSLLPSFCNYPVDTAESFKGLKRALCTALQEEPEVRGLICSGLQILIQQNKRILEGNSPNTEIGASEERAIALYTADVTGLNMTILKSCAREFLSVLTGVYSESSKDTSGIVQSTIGELASISDKEVVTRFFGKTMEKLLKVTLEVGKSRNSKDSNSMQVDNSSDEGSLSIARAQLFDLAVSLLPGLDSREIDLLFSALTPAWKDVNGLIQKKSYRALSMLFPVLK